MVAYDNPLTSAVANRVIGQPNFTTYLPDYGGPASAGNLHNPAAAVVDGSGRLWVADANNNRVLEYDNPLTSPVANRVIGQPGFASDTPNTGGISASSLWEPLAIAVDSAGRLWVADAGNHRVLEYDNPLTSPVANRVLGQPDFTSGTPNTGGISASSLSSPAGVAVDASGRLFVAEQGNNRVLEYDNPLTSSVANRVFGQPNFTSGTANNGGVSASSLWSPTGVAVDGGGRLWVTEQGNNRVLEFDGVAVVTTTAVGGIAEQADVTALRSGASSSRRSSTIYVAAVGVTSVFAAAAGAVGWRRRRLARKG